MTRITAAEIFDVYQATGSVWKTGERLGISGQTVHAKLRSAGYKTGNAWTPDEVEKLSSMVGMKTLGQMADTLGRSYASIACKLNELQIGPGPVKPPLKVPRGHGYDKISTRKHLKTLETSSLTITKYARQNGLNIESFIRVVERHFPDWLHEYRRTTTDLQETNCGYCKRSFYPSNKRHVYCSRKCQSQQRVDADYFGGARRNTIGLAEGTCQICRRQPQKGLSSHHVLGKENDPENEYLVALCSGCHNVITALGARDFDNEQWEALVSFAWMRRHGPEIAKWSTPKDLTVSVEIEVYEPEDDE